ncbi:MAG: GNAT family N-acetyltransferase [Promethearchaeota archaeon]
MYEVEELKYSESSYNKILGNLRESLTYYFVETLQEDLKEADFWFEWIENIIRAEGDEYICFQVRSDEDIIGFVIINYINKKFALIRHFFIIDTVNREEVAFILLEEVIERLKHNNKINKFRNAAFTFPEDYLAKPLKRLGFRILKRQNMTLSLNTFDKTSELPSEYSFAPFNKENQSKIAELSVHIYKNHPDASFWEEINSVPLYLEYLEKSMTTYFLKDCSLIVKNEKDQIVGLCLTEKGDEEGEIIIQNIAVNKSYQGNGIGKALLSRVLEIIRKEGYKKAILTVTEGITAQKMYESFGFRKYTSFNIITNA